MATTPSEDLNALTRWLIRTKSTDEIKEIAETAAADMLAGKDVTSVSFEGGSGSITRIVDASTILAACEDALVALGDSTATSTRSRSIFTNFGVQTLQT
jgi:hypothetical protein